MIVTTWPAMVRVPVLAEPLFELIRTSTVPLPVPLAPEVIDNQDPPVVTAAVHAHWLLVLTVNVLVVCESLT